MGQERRFGRSDPMSAIPPIASEQRTSIHVGEVPAPDIKNRFAPWLAKRDLKDINTR
jgi:hypothetical protein